MICCRTRFALIMLILVASSATTLAADWPTWRHDQYRSGASPEQLAPALHLQWVWKLAKTRPAWPYEPRSQFDAAYQPIVAGGLMFLGSPNDDSVSAYDVETGRRVWRFFADGPVRFAPAAHKGRIYFVSDDGYLYCLNASDGELVWKFQGGPARRSHMGNGRLVSFWPARGGPVVADDTVYFGAGLWPTMGVFVHAVDAVTGKAVWTNNRAHHIADVQLDHTFRGAAGISPQGYLVATDNVLVVPNGRSMPAYLDRRTGRLLHYVQGYRQGNWHVTADGRVLTIDGHFYGFQRCLKGVNDAFFTDLYNPGPKPMDDHVLTRRFLYGLAEGVVNCYPTGGIVSPKAVKKTKPPIFWWKKGYSYGGAISYMKYSTPKLWAFNAIGGKPRARPRSNDYFWRPAVLIKAGGRLYGSDHNTLFAVDVGRGGASPSATAWKKTIKQTPAGILAAAGKLIVVTREGSILCYGAKPGNPLPKATDRFTALADEALKIAGAAKGYAVVLGVGSGRLAEELLSQSELNVIVVEENKEKADAYRQKLIAADLYGTRAQVVVGKPFEYSLPPFLATLVVSEDWKSAGFSCDGVPARKIFRVLRPYGGAACLDHSVGGPQALRKWALGENLRGVEMTETESFSVLRRSGALPGAADWSHGTGDVGNTLFSRDTYVKPPLGVLWYSNADAFANYGSKVHVEAGANDYPKIVRGRMFELSQRAIREPGGAKGAKPRLALEFEALDVYTGLLLWKRKVPCETGAAAGVRFVVAGDRAYVVSGTRLLIIDASDGKTLKTSTLNVPDKQEEVPESSGAITQPVGRDAEWHYLAGSDPKSDDWTMPGYDLTGWKKGRPGFGYGDGDNRTVLSDMRNHYTTVYLRTEFEVDNVEKFLNMGLMADYDDAFIAYINGHEVLRVGVGKGRGKSAESIQQAEIAGQYSFFELKDLKAALRTGTNILAIEGHNVSLDSSDFCINAFLQIGYEPPKRTPIAMNIFAVDDVLLVLYGFTENPKKLPEEKTFLVALDRGTGEALWSRRAQYAFNNRQSFIEYAPRISLAGGDGMVFLNDAVTSKSLRKLKRRGIKADSTCTLMALDARTGRVLWTQVDQVPPSAGDYLSYSRESGILLAHRHERLRGIEGRTGKILWEMRHDIPFAPLMVGPKTFYGFRPLKKIHVAGYIFTCHVYDNATGRIIMRDVFQGEMFNCNYAVGAPYFLTRRDLTFASYVDMPSGETHLLRNVRSGCNASLLPANGLIVSPNRSVGCICNHPLQTAFALAPMPEAPEWPGSVFGK